MILFYSIPGKIRERALKAEYEFSITAKEVWHLYLAQGKRCYLSGLPVYFKRDQDKGYMQTASVDRIDPLLGYTTNNIQILHKRVNRLKAVMNNKEVIEWCNIIAKLHKTSSTNNLLEGWSDRKNDKKSRCLNCGFLWLPRSEKSLCPRCKSSNINHGDIK